MLGFLWPGGLGRFTLVRPIVLKGFAKLDKVFEIHRLYREGISAKLVGLIDVPELVGRGQDDYAHGSQSRLLAYPTKDLETVRARHLQVQQHQVRKRIFVPV